ncbi:ependymin-related protein 2-like isoform X1 [Babylonia areolata]|uniref:ependymin-related protein 2-like isoform X1 n=1 Tax=Babylonia areolata TaxID=304850 RepID=UPI003FD40B7C
MAFEEKSILLLFLLLTGLLVSPAHGVGKDEEVPTPCCFPSSFQATVADMRSVATGQMRLFEVYRDWDRRLQAHRVMTFAPPGQVAPVMTMILDFAKSVEYIISASGDCQSRPLEYAMLEPCMPEDAVLLGETYLGFGEDATRFRAWSFKRSDHGRNISMTVAVTHSDCVPVMETITGTMGRASVDTMATFTSFTELQNLDIFDVPPSCSVLM